MTALRHCVRFGFCSPITVLPRLSGSGAAYPLFGKYEFDASDSVCWEVTPAYCSNVLIRRSSWAIRISAACMPLQLCVFPPNCKLKQPLIETQSSVDKQTIAIVRYFMPTGQDVKQPPRSYYRINQRKT